MLEAKKITASYREERGIRGFARGKKQVLENINFSLEKGQCIGMIGMNGVGKSTLLSILAGVHKPDSGQLLFQGKDLFLKENRKQLRKLSGYVPQDNPLMEELSVFDNLRLWYIDQKKLEEELETGRLSEFGLKEYLKVPVRKLSGGLKKRVNIACAIADDPEVLIMDEPTQALDMICKKEILDYMEKCKRNGKSVIFTTHDETEFKICDKLFLLYAGKLEEVSPHMKGKDCVSSLLELQRKY
mgnify:CR=1 FL=1